MRIRIGVWRPNTPSSECRAFGSCRTKITSSDPPLLTIGATRAALVSSLGRFGLSGAEPPLPCNTAIPRDLHDFDPT